MARDAGIDDSSVNDNGEQPGDVQRGAASTSASSQSPNNMDAPRPGLKPVLAILALIKSELGLPEVTSMADTIAQSTILLGLALADTMPLEEKAVRVARELNIAIADG